MSDLENPLVFLSYDRVSLETIANIARSCPDVAFIGMLDETIVALWTCFWRLPSARRERTDRLESVRMKTIALFGEQDDARQMIAVRDAERLEKIRVFSLIRTVLDRVYGISERNKQIWSYMVFCNQDGFPSREIHHQIFPKARYVCVLPNPFAPSVVNLTDHGMLATYFIDWARFYDSAESMIGPMHTLCKILLIDDAEGSARVRDALQGFISTQDEGEGFAEIHVPFAIKQIVENIAGFAEKIEALGYRITYTPGANQY